MGFPTTHWSLLAEATLSGNPAGRAALEALCSYYRPPVVAFLRSRGFASEQVEDLAQDFFAELLTSRAWRRADRAQGKFRSFLLGALMHALAHAREYEHAGKRGGGVIPLSLDALAEDGFEPPGAQPEVARAFDREWALQLISETSASLAAEYVAAGRGDEFAALIAYLPGAAEPPAYAETALRLGQSVAAVTTLVHRLRARFREELRATVARTVSAPHEVDGELAYLRAVLLDRATAFQR